MNFSTEPMVTDSKPFSMTQLPSHRPVLRADAAANLREVVGRRRQLVGLLEPALGR
jgi:hypothetical protein